MKYGPNSITMLVVKYSMITFLLGNGKLNVSMENPKGITIHEL
jgi:hypothetical protein